ncbi:MAG: pheromone processing endoprotease [Watsoniomyces obsoletus]|nr:MAG: pheromone processing endoprotease [Watsoniomyces obsoletus]
MDSGDFDSITWANDGDANEPRPSSPSSRQRGRPSSNGKQRATTTTTNTTNTPTSPQAGRNADALDLAGVGEGRLDCTVSSPQKENEGTKDAFVSYLVTTHTDFPSFQKPTSTVRRRFTDFVFLYKTLSRDYPACAVPPLPDKHKLEYVRGDRFGPDFTNRRAYSLHRFLKRLTLHPVLRRSTLLVIFLESPDWNAHMRLRPQRTGSSSDPNNPSSSSSSGGTSVFDNLTDTFLNAFSKVHKPDRRFIEVREKCDKLDEDLGHVEKIVARVARREGDLEGDYTDLATQFRKLVNLEAELEGPLHSFASSIESTSSGLRKLKDHTDQNYFGSLRDMEAYIVALRGLLKTREQKQLDFEALSDYLARAATERDLLASQYSSYSSSSTGTHHHGGGGGSAGGGGSGGGGGSSGGGMGIYNPLTSPSGFLRSKIEDVRGVDHEQAQREKVRKLELRIDELTREVEAAKKLTEAFDEEVVREVADFERIKAVEFRDTLGGLADANRGFYKNVINEWEGFLGEMERERDVDDTNGNGGERRIHVNDE